MLEILGSRYAIDCCVSAFLEKQTEKSYQFYITDCLRIITENTSKAAGGGTFVTTKFSDLIENKKTKEFKKGEIVQKIKSKFKSLEVKNDELI